MACPHGYISPISQRAGISGVPADRGIREQGEEVKTGMEFDRGT